MDAASPAGGPRWSLLAFAVTAVPSAFIGYKIGAGAGWWLIAGTFIAVPSAFAGIAVYHHGTGIDSYGVAFGLPVFAFCAMFAFAPACLAVAGVRAEGVVARVSDGESESGTRFSRFHIEDPATGRDLGILRNPRGIALTVGDRLPIVRDPLATMSSSPDVWGPFDIVSGVVGGLAGVLALVSGATAPRRHRAAPAEPPSAR